MEDKFVNAELLIIFARFCDFVMCFELEAENLYLKGTAIMNSIKIQQSKENINELSLENKMKN